MSHSPLVAKRRWRYLLTNVTDFDANDTTKEFISIISEIYSHFLILFLFPAPTLGKSI